MVGMIPYQTVCTESLNMRNISSEKREAITQAADRLVSEGREQPTNDDVRTAMGGGSIADISPVMREWRESRSSISARVEMPDAAKKAGDKFVGQLWLTLNQLTSGAVENTRQECEERIKVYEAEKDEAFSEIELLESKISSLEDSLSGIQQNFDDASGEVRDLLDKVRSLDVEREKAITQANAVREALEDSQAQLKEARASNSKLQDKLISLVEDAEKKT
ncbi:DNA-binding protein [Halieaceae bacterium IMCC14734]|uniref:DNA-binding protein n=2 Tax=Candidatus Litorirhabdus singularis TaxID=2518993 RepID=A0ABT3TKE5_9GAMM|nr:DNA-binding protein [Candidatus Litorirhabdus singularis]